MAKKVFELTDVRIAYGRLLFFRSANPANAASETIPRPILVPFGSVSPREILNYSFFVVMDDSNIVELYAQAKLANARRIRILPAYRWTGQIESPGFGKVDVSIRELVHDVDRIRATEILMRSHYLHPPYRGLFLGCWLTDGEQMKKIRKKKRGSAKELWSDAWDEVIAADGNMVGCAVLDTLFHGLPRGRKSIISGFRLANFLDRARNWTADRIQVVDRLGVAWASRFAVDEPYRALRIGTLLATHLVEIAHSYRVPSAKFIEVLTTEPSKEADLRRSEAKTKTSFLGRAGYTLAPDESPSRRMLMPDADGNRIEFRSAKKLYYYIQTEPDAKRKR